MFEHLLIPLDGSSLAECVLPHGLAMAQALGARVTLLQVVEQEETASPPRGIDPEPPPRHPLPTAPAALLSGAASV